MERLLERFHGLKPRGRRGPGIKPALAVGVCAAGGGGPPSVLGGPAGNRLAESGSCATFRVGRPPQPPEEGVCIFTFYGEGAPPGSMSGHRTRSPRPRTARRLSETCFFLPLFSFLPSISPAARFLSPPRRRVRRPAQLRLAAGRGPTTDRSCAPGRGPAAERKPRWPPPPCPPRSPCRPRTRGLRRGRTFRSR